MVSVRFGQKNLRHANLKFLVYAIFAAISWIELLNLKEMRLNSNLLVPVEGVAVADGRGIDRYVHWHHHGIMENNSKVTWM